MRSQPDISKEHQEAFDRLIKLLPLPLQKKADIQETIMKILKIHGEDFVGRAIRESFGKYRKTNQNTNS